MAGYYEQQLATIERNTHSNTDSLGTYDGTGWGHGEASLCSNESIWGATAGWQNCHGLGDIDAHEGDERTDGDGSGTCVNTYPPGRQDMVAPLWIERVQI